MIEDRVRRKIQNLIARAGVFTTTDSGLAVNQQEMAACRSWLTEALNTVEIAIPLPDNAYRRRLQKIIEGPAGSGVLQKVQSVAGIFQALLRDDDEGLLQEVAPHQSAVQLGAGVEVQQAEMIAILEGYKADLEGILSRFKDTRDGLYIDRDDEGRFRTLVLELSDLFNDHFVDGESHSRMLTDYYNNSLSNYLNVPSCSGVESVLGLVTSTVTRVSRNPQSLKAVASHDGPRQEQQRATIEMLVRRLDIVVRQLQDRQRNRQPFEVNDEYDIQDLFHALLKIFFNNVKPEETTPSYAGSSSRMDFLLPEIKTVVELKMARPSLSTKDLRNQLIIDIDSYQAHHECRTLYCVVYDPEQRVGNPHGFENDLSRDGQMTVRVIVVPK
jgi:hypothetical protein